MTTPNAPIWANAAAVWNAATGAWERPAQPHPRAEIRKAVVAALAAQIGDPPAYMTDCAARVFPSRVEPLLMKTLPAIAVYTVDESIDRNESSIWNDPDNPGYLKRRLKLAIEIVAPGERSDDTLDQIALQVEAVMDADPSLGKRVESLILDETEIAFIDNGEKLIGVARLTYDIVYRTQAMTPPADPGVMPQQILGSWAPHIGRAHIDDYVDITNTGVPPLP